MPVHDIDVTIPAQSVRNTDLVINIKGDGRQFGRLLVSRGSIDWVPANSPITRRMSWERFAELMDSEGQRLTP